MAATLPLAKTASLLSRSVNLPTMPFWVSGSVSTVGDDDTSHNTVCTFDAMPQEVCCAFTMSLGACGDSAACKVGIDAENSMGSAFLLVRLRKSFEHGNRVVVQRPVDVMPDVRVFYGDVFDGRRLEARRMLLRGDDVTIPLGGDATFSVEGSIFKPCVLRMRFTHVPEEKHAGSISVVPPRILAVAPRMGDLQHCAIQRTRATMDATDIALVDSCLDAYVRATFKQSAPYGMSNSIMASALGVRYFTEGNARAFHVGATRLVTADLRAVYATVLRGLCASHTPPPHEMVVEPVESALAHAMDIVHCPSRVTSEIPWDVLDIHKTTLERDARLGSLAAVGLLLSMQVKRPLRCFPLGVVYHHTQHIVHHKQEAMLALMLQMAMHSRDLWVLPLQLTYEASPKQKPAKRARHSHSIVPDTDIFMCPPGAGQWTGSTCMRVQMFSPIPLSVRAYMLALLAIPMADADMARAQVQVPAPSPVALIPEHDCDYVPLRVRLMGEADNVLVSLDIMTHSAWATVLSQPMSAWEHGTVDLLLATAGCLATFPSSVECKADVDILRSPGLVLQRAAPMHFVFKRTAGGDYPPTIAEETGHQFPWICRGMMHVTPSRALTITGVADAGDVQAQIELFAALTTIVGEYHGSIRMIRLDAPITVQQGAIPALCTLLRHPQLVAFQARCMSFDGIAHADLYAQLGRSCEHQLYVEFGAAKVTVNVRAASKPSAHRMDGINGRVLALRDAALLTAHLTEQQCNQHTIREFLHGQATHVEAGVPSFTHLWRTVI